VPWTRSAEIAAQKPAGSSECCRRGNLSHPTVIRAMRQDRRSKVHRPFVAYAAAAGKRDQSGSRSRALLPHSRTKTARRHESGGAAAGGSNNADATSVSPWPRAMTRAGHRFSTQQIPANQRAEENAEPAKTLLIDECGSRGQGRAGIHEVQAAKTGYRDLEDRRVIEGRYKFIERSARARSARSLMEAPWSRSRLILEVLEPTCPRREDDEALRARAALQPQDHAQERHPHLRFPVHPRQLRHFYEYFPSHTLGGEIVNEKPVLLKRAIKFGIDIATGMAVAHQAGIVHRDLKPANILIDNDGCSRSWTSAWRRPQTQGDTQLTKTGYVIGSPKYMAPEQILGKEGGPNGPILQLGRHFCHECSAAYPPSSRGDHMSVMVPTSQNDAQAVRYRPVRPPSFPESVPAPCTSATR